MTDLNLWIPAELTELKLPSTPGRIEWFTKWAAGEGTGAHFNPLATTLPGLEDPTDPFWNTFTIPGGAVLHVRNYKDLASGVVQTANTIRQANFALILQSLQQEQVIPGVAAVIRSSWGTTAFADQLDSGWVPTGWGTPTVFHPVTLDELVAYLGGADAIRTWNANGNSLTIGYGNLSKQVQDAANILADHISNHAAGVGVVAEHKHDPGKVTRP